MTLPTFTMRQLLEAGVHFGHSTRRWNPKMDKFLFGERNKIHIIDLQQTVPLLHQALVAVRNIAANGGRILFVGTKRQASIKIADAARKSGQYFVNHRWLGGTMTNWRTVSNSITRLRALDDQLSGDIHGFTKKELLGLTREREKLERALGGIKEMGGLPDILVVIDTNKEANAVAEANKLEIPVVAIIDSNSNPDGIDHPIPGNDDASRSIQLYCDLISDSILDGMQAEMVEKGEDIGAKENRSAAETPEEKTTKNKPQEDLPPNIPPKSETDSNPNEREQDQNKNNLEQDIQGKTAILDEASETSSEKEISKSIVKDHVAEDNTENN